MLSVVIDDAAVKSKVSRFHTAGFGEPDPDVNVPEVPPAEASTLTGPPKAVELPP
jgi:hypothetical protein